MEALKLKKLSNGFGIASNNLSNEMFVITKQGVQQWNNMQQTKNDALKLVQQNYAVYLNKNDLDNINKKASSISLLGVS